MAYPLAYLITFRCHGSFLHGDPRGSVDRQHNRYGTPLLSAHRFRRLAMWESLAEPPARLGNEQRVTVLGSLVETCLHRHWNLLAAHVRSNHVHAVVAAPSHPEVLLHDLKAYATRALKLSIEGRQRWWSRHGSTKYLWNPVSVEAAICYVVEAQGEPMAVYRHGTAPVMARPE